MALRSLKSCMPETTTTVYTLLVVYLSTIKVKTVNDGLINCVTEAGCEKRQERLLWVEFHTLKFVSVFFFLNYNFQYLYAQQFSNSVALILLNGVMWWLLILYLDVYILTLSYMQLTELSVMWCCQLVSEAHKNCAVVYLWRFCWSHSAPPANWNKSVKTADYVIHSAKYSCLHYDGSV